MKILTYLITALAPVILAWVLGFMTVPEATNYLDYSSGGSELLKLSDELKKEVKVYVGNDEKDQLSIYSIHFINKSGKHYGKTKISFNIEGKNQECELIASSLQGPENYPSDSVNKISENDKSITFLLDHINRAGDQPRNYFTVSFLFSGANPDRITPVCYEKGIEFRPASKNKREKIIATAIFSGALIAYFLLLWWLSKLGKKRLLKKENEYSKKVAAFIEGKFHIDQGNSSIIVNQINEIRSSTFKHQGLIKSVLRKFINEP